MHQSKNSQQYRAEGYATIFRNGHVYLIRRDDPTLAHTHPIRSGLWMECPIEDMGQIALAHMAAPLRDDIRATLAACYCDQGGVNTCDFCGNIRRPEPARPQYVLYADTIAVWRGDNPPTQEQVNEAGRKASQDGWNGTILDLFHGPRPIDLRYPEGL